MKTKDLIYYAIFAAMTAILSQIVIPLPFTPVPINLALLAPLLAGGLLGARGGAVSQAVYLLLGLLGLPVFTSFRAGPGVLFGPTGGYIIGYIAAAWLSGQKLWPKKTGFFHDLCVMALGILACYLLGTVWFMILTKNGLISSLIACVLPFLPGDCVKALAGAYLTKKLRPILKNWS